MTCSCTASAYEESAASGDDTVVAGTGHDTLISSSGDDTIVYDPTRDTLQLGAGRVTLVTVVPPSSLAIEGSASPVINTSTVYNALYSVPPGEDVASTWQILDANGDLIDSYAGDYYSFTPGRVGSYTLILTVTNSLGVFSTVSETVNAVPFIPAVVRIANPPNTVSEGSLVTLEGSLQGFDAATLKETWTVTRDGGIPFATGTGASFSFTPPDDGVYTVVLTASDANHAPIASSPADILVTNVAPSNLIASLNAVKLVEGQAVSVQGSFTDPGTLDTHVVDINWGDGSPDTIVSLPAGVLSFGSGAPITHTYLDNPAGQPLGSYAITITVVDKEQAPTTLATPLAIEVDNAPPSALNLSLTDPVINENGSTSLDGSFSDPGTLDAHVVTINWGDGTTSTLNLPAGVLNFSGIAHRYLDNKPGDAAYTISATVADKDSASTFNTTAITVHNLAATGIVLTPSTTNPSRGQAFSLAGVFSDPGTLDTHTVDINWGDGSAHSTLTLTAGVLNFAGAAHTYASSSLAQATGKFIITVTIVDKDNAAGLGSLTILVTPNLGLLLLDPTGSGALQLSGNGSITVNNGAIVVDSTSTTAALISGNGTVNSNETDVVGTARVTGNGRFTPTPTKTQPLADPFSALAAPAAPTTTYSAVNLSGNSSMTLQPGTYVGGIKLSGNGNITLAPGVYYLRGGGLILSGNGSITGNGVLIINAPNGATDGLILSGNGNINLTPPTTLPAAYTSLRGMTYFQAPAATAPITLSGSGSLNITGTVYAPKAILTLSGNGSIVVNGNATNNVAARAILADLRLTGNGSVTINAAAPGVGNSAQLGGNAPGGSSTLAAVPSAHAAAIDALAASPTASASNAVSLIADPAILDDLATTVIGVARKNRKTN
ncbi:MAG: hypothetical protein U0794_06945 [Isosphaeraceae bacterium]